MGQEQGLYERSLLCHCCLMVFKKRKDTCYVGVVVEVVEHFAIDY